MPTRGAKFRNPPLKGKQRERERGGEERFLGAASGRRMGRAAPKTGTTSLAFHRGLQVLNNYYFESESVTTAPALLRRRVPVIRNFV